MAIERRIIFLVINSSSLLHTKRNHWLIETAQDQSNYSIIRVTLNTELDTLWFAALSSQTKALIDQLSIDYKSTDLGGCF